MFAWILAGCMEQGFSAATDVGEPTDGPALRITPDPLDLGPVGVGCELSGTVNLENVGNTTLTIDEVVLEGGSFELLSELDLPVELRPEQSVPVELAFLPQLTGVMRSELTVFSDDPRGPLAGDQYGEGTEEGEPFTERWEMASNPPTDILFSLDSSCSMTTDIWQMYLNFEPFIELLESLTGDWQVMVANRDDGCNQAGILTPDTPNYTDAFQSALFAWNWDSDYTEALLTVNDHAVAESKAGGCNAGFMRDEAMLHIIDISDEPEQSQWLTGESWESLVDSIRVHKGSSAMTTISAIAGDVPNGCDDAAAGTGYWEAVEETGGVFLSVCDEWYDQSSLNLLAEASVNQDRFVLSRPAVEDSIAVYVNGNERDSWSYDDASWTVTVLTNPPSDGDVVDIDYVSMGACE